MAARDPFEPKASDRRVRVYGCSPGCLLISLGVSVLLTILLNVLIRLFQPRNIRRVCVYAVEGKNKHFRGVEEWRLGVWMWIVGGAVFAALFFAFAWKTKQPFAHRGQYGRSVLLAFMRRLTGVREAYRRADLRLRMLLFGDAENAAGRLKGEEHRQQAARDLRKMRDAFDDAVEEAEKSNLPDDLKERAIEAKEKQSDPTKDERRGQS